MKAVLGNMNVFKDDFLAEVKAQAVKELKLELKEAVLQEIQEDYQKVNWSFKELVEASGMKETWCRQNILEDPRILKFGRNLDGKKWIFNAQMARSYLEDLAINRKEV